MTGEARHVRPHAVEAGKRRATHRKVGDPASDDALQPLKLAGGLQESPRSHGDVREELGGLDGGTTRVAVDVEALPLRLVASLCLLALRSADAGEV
eukprot:15594583-Heterocapsa_arctica.AAC.1